MPEDYQAILSGLGVDTTQDPAGQGDPAGEPNVNNTDPAPAGDTGNTGDDGNTNTQNPADNAGAQDIEAQRRNEAFAAMRSENAKYKKFMQQIMKGAGFSGKEEDFMNNLTEASYQRQAKLQGSQVSPELLKRMDTLESQNKALIDSQNKQAFASNLKTMQETLRLDDKEVKEFIDMAVNEKIDLLNPTTNFVALYQGIFFDKLMTKRVEEERQKWIEQNSKSNHAANPDGKSGKKDPDPVNVNTMAEFDSLLQQSFPNKK